jgi:hypothetical protein
MSAHATSFSAALRALVPPPDADEAAYLPAFRRLAALILGGATWHIGGQPHRFTEIELYWNGPGHPDTFTHGDPMQQEFGRWYFHRSGATYRGGSYKGLDIAVGDEQTFAGILIRGAERLADAALVDGPSMCVDHVLAATGCATIVALVDGFDRGVDEAPGSPLYVTLTDPPRPLEIVESPRFGLTLKRGELRERAAFLARPYRFLSEPARIKKGRAHTVIGMFRQGVAAEEIALRTGSSRAQVLKILGEYEAGAGLDPRSFVRDLSSDETCRLFGACDAFTGE